MRIILFACVALFFVGCPEGSDGAADAGGTATTGSNAGSGANPAGGSTGIIEVTTAEYQHLCERLEYSMDLETYVECSSAGLCENCFDVLLAVPQEDSCADRIGIPEHYIQRNCTWTIGQLHECFDERDALKDRLSCSRPLLPGEESTCLSDFADACTLSSGL